MALIDKASLLMVPSTYEAGKLYNVLPSGNRAPDSTGENSGYDQTRADFDFDRGTNAAATRVNADGLIEKYRENKLLQSNQFDTTWSNVLSGSITSGQSGYDGTNNAWKLSKGATAYRYIIQSLSVSGVYTFSLYAKADSLNQVTIFNDTGATNPYAKFSLVDGSIVASSGLIDSSATDVGNGWWRLSATFNTTITTARIYPDFAETTAGSIYIQNAQLESGMVSTDYLESTSVTGKAGVLIDLPRIDYSSGAGALLLEPSRQQLLQHSEYFGDSSWIKGGSSVVGGFTSPEGLNNAYKLVEDTNNSNHNIYNFGSKTINLDYSVSIYVKNNGRNFCYIEFSSYLGVFNGGKAFFDLVDGVTAYKDANITSDIEELSNGYYRITATQQSLASGNGVIAIGLSNTDGSSSYQGDGTSGVYIYGAQVEAGSYSTSYIPNHGESGGVTRAADSCSVTGVSDVIGQTEGTLFFDWIMNHESPNTSEDLYTLTLSNGSSSEILAIGNYNQTLVVFITDTTNQFYDSSYTGGADGARIKLALAYANNDIALYINGTQIATDSSATIPTLSQIRLNTFWNGNLADSTRVNQLLLFKTRLTNAELAALTL